MAKQGYDKVNTHYKIHKYIAALGVLVFAITGCVPYYTTEKAAVVIYNNTHQDIKYSAYLSGRWLPDTQIKQNIPEYLINYEADSANEPLPHSLGKLKFILPNCTFKMGRKDLDSHFVRDPGGRRGWNLYIDDQLLRDYGCHAH